MGDTRANTASLIIHTDFFKYRGSIGIFKNYTNFLA